jgi:ParB-like chromosome segregation protein Spo0J
MLTVADIPLDAIVTHHDSDPVTVAAIMPSMRERGLIKPVILIERGGALHLAIGANRVEVARLASRQR